ncbi:MAG TPA: 2-oxoacid:acceptor oxidoreductase family protein [Spirochaetales bacterium]|nr:2-oxoacid:acceptor oxidoreductase family protein [Spirochaetales bacterium]
MIGNFDIYIAGVGGQGIGLLSEALIRAVDHAGMIAKGCDTHGLAQRGGSVSSHVRVGADARSPLVSEGSADLVVALERHEAVSAGRKYLKEGGTLLWFDASWQPLDVRLGKARAAGESDVEEVAALRKGTAVRVDGEGLPDPRMQNVAMLAALCRRGLVPGLSLAHARAALSDLMAGAALDANLALLAD